MLELILPLPTEATVMVIPRVAGRAPPRRQSHHDVY
jgi:hypothetical protein